MSGYLALAERLYSDAATWSGAWNFGPREEDAKTVAAIADTIIRLWGSGRWSTLDEEGELHEARSLMLDSSRARRCLGWSPVCRIEDALQKTVEWRRALGDSPSAARSKTSSQIETYQRQLIAREEESDASAVA